MTGAFAEHEVSAALVAAGYREQSYRGARLFVLHDIATPGPVVAGDALSAAGVVALLDHRLITAGATGDVREAVDAALGRRPSLADDPMVARLVETLAPLTGLIVSDATLHAGRCNGVAVRTEQTLAGFPIAVGFGHLGPGGVRRTLVAVGFPDQATAGAAASAFAAGWLGDQITADSVRAPLTHFGRLNNISQSGALLVAEFLDGRVEGWAPAAIRFADPVCNAAIDLARRLPASPTA
jgi:hypothetical protein